MNRIMPVVSNSVPEATRANTHIRPASLTPVVTELASTPPAKEVTLAVSGWSPQPQGSRQRIHTPSRSAWRIPAGTYP